MFDWKEDLNFDFEHLFGLFNVKSAVLDQYIADIEEIKTVYKLIGDEPSRYQFISELAFQILLSEQYKGTSFFSPVYVINQRPISYQWQIERKFTKNFTKMKLKYPPYKECEDYYISSTLYKTFELQQYCYKNEVDNIDISPTEKDICLDAGAFFGDTAAWFLEEMDVKKVYSFEPQSSIISLFKENLREYLKQGRCEVLETLISNYNGWAHMQDLQYNLAANRIIENDEAFKKKYGCQNMVENGKKIKVVTLDDFCKIKEIIPTFIKMDIEGAELNALEGSKELIQKYKPTLAICVYHKPNHLYKIPFLISKYRPDYKFFYKKSGTFSENVLFGI